MAKVTSKLQVTIPKAIADQYGIVPGDEIEFQAAGDVIRIVPPRARARTRRLTLEERLRLFDAAIERQRRREQSMTVERNPATGRGWKREDLYTRGEPR